MFIKFAHLYNYGLPKEIKMLFFSNFRECTLILPTNSGELETSDTIFKFVSKSSLPTIAAFDRYTVVCWFIFKF